MGAVSRVWEKGLWLRHITNMGIVGLAKGCEKSYITDWGDESGRGEIAVRFVEVKNSKILDRKATVEKRKRVAKCDPFDTI